MLRRRLFPRWYIYCLEGTEPRFWWDFPGGSSVVNIRCGHGSGQIYTRNEETGARLGENYPALLAWQFNGVLRIRKDVWQRPISWRVANDRRLGMWMGSRRIPTGRVSSTLRFTWTSGIILLLDGKCGVCYWLTETWSANRIYPNVPGKGPHRGNPVALRFGPALEATVCLHVIKTAGA